MIYTMNTKTFDKIFARESVEKIERSSFLVISKRIRKSEEMDAVIFAKKLFPSDYLLADYRAGKDPLYFKEKYWEQLDDSKLTLAIAVKNTIEEKVPLICICTKREWSLGFMKLFAEYIEDRFEYPVIDYKKYKLKKIQISEIPYSPENTRKICNQVIKEEQKRKQKEKESTMEGRYELVTGMSKDEMRLMLKRINLYTPGLTKSEMRELLEDFFVK